MRYYASSKLSKIFQTAKYFSPFLNQPSKIYILMDINNKRDVAMKKTTSLLYTHSMS